MSFLSRIRIGRLAQYVALGAYLVFLAFPLVWLISTSFKTPPELQLLNPTIFPESLSLDNFRDAFRSQPLVKAGLNSLVVASVSSVLTVMVATPAAYVLSRFKSKLSKLALGWVLVSQLFPFILIIIPLFLMLRGIGLADSRVGLILVYMVFSLPFALWLLQGYVKAVPVTLEEAAMLDGCSRAQMLRRVVGPLMLPGIIATVLFGFLLSWNEFFFALILLKNPDIQTLPVVLVRFKGAEGVARLGPLAAGSLLATLPSLALFGLIQRRLVSGIMSGAVKG